MKAMKRFWLIILGFVLGIAMSEKSFGQDYNWLPPISDSADYYLITCEPGNEIYEKFGHSGIRVKDGEWDITFNWGLFSFEEPNFIGKFVLGETDYMMGYCQTEVFLCDYRERGSAVYQHRLNLSQQEKTDLWNAISENWKVENRVYRYNFIYDNCATRIYEIIFNAIGKDEVENIYADAPYGTYRDIVNGYVGTDSWISLGINFVFGSEADKRISYKESTTFPLEMMTLLESVKKRGYIDGYDVKEPLLGKGVVLFNGDKLYKKNGKNTTAKEFLLFMIPILISLVLLIHFIRVHGHYYKVPTIVLLWLSVVFSILIIFLSVFSSHPLVHDNYNLLWCNPLNALLAIVLVMRHRHMLKGCVAFVTTVCTLLCGIVYLMGEQEYTMVLFGWWILFAVLQILVLLSYLQKTFENIKAWVDKHLGKPSIRGHHSHHRHHVHSKSHGGIRQGAEHHDMNHHRHHEHKY